MSLKFSYKRFLSPLLCLLLVFSLVLSCATPTQAASISRYVNGFSVSKLNTNSSGDACGWLEIIIQSNSAAFFSLLYYLGFEDQCILFGCSDYSLYGLYWNSLGQLCIGEFVNPLGSCYYKLLGVRRFVDLSFVACSVFKPNAYKTRTVYFSESHALASGDVDWAVICWEDGFIPDSYSFYFRNEDGNEYTSYLYQNGFFDYFYGVYSRSDVLWDTTDPDPDTVDPVKYPVWSIDIEGGFWNYLTLGSDAPTLQVEALSMDGGTISYQWCKQNCNNASSSTIPGATSNTYTPPTDEVGSWMYWCTATNTCADGSHISITSSTYCLTVTSHGGAATDNISWTVNDSGILVISGKGAMPSYSSADQYPWYEHKDKITQVVISEGITTVGNNAFSEYASLKSISLPSSLLSIGESAFYRCTLLDAVSLPRSLVSIGKRGFAFCYSLTSMTIPQNCVSIGQGAFSATNRLTDIFMESAEPPSIGTYVFYLDTVVNRHIYVPYGSKADYVAAEKWSEYADIIVEIDQPTFEDTMQDQMGDIQDSLGDVNQGIQDTNDKLDDITDYVPVPSVPSGEDIVNNLVSNEDQLVNDAMDQLGAFNDISLGFGEALSLYYGGLLVLSSVINEVASIPFFSSLLYIGLGLGLFAFFLGVGSSVVRSMGNRSDRPQNISSKSSK